MLGTYALMFQNPAYKEQRWKSQCTQIVLNSHQRAFCYA